MPNTTDEVLRPLAVLSDAPFREIAEAPSGSPKPDRMQYGMEHILAFGYLPRTGRKASGAFRTKLRDLIEHRLGYPVEIPLSSWGNIRESGLVLASLEHNAKLALKLKERGVKPFKSAKVVVLNCWLAERLPGMTEPERHEWVRLLNLAAAVTVWSENQIEILTSFGVERSLLHSINFGVNSWLGVGSENSVRDIDVVAVGMDVGRDYKSLFEAAKGQPWNVVMACKPVNLKGLDVPENVEILGLIPRDDYRNLLQRAKVVVVPTHSFAYPTGQSVALEGAMAGAAIVVSNSLPMRQYFEPNVTALMPEVHDVAGIRDAVATLLSDETLRKDLAAAGQKRVSSNFTDRQMWRQVAEILDQIA